MSKEAYLSSWMNNTKNSLKKNEQELSELVENRESDLERYELYANKIRDWLKDDLFPEVREELEFKLGFLENQEQEIDSKISMIKSRIESDKFIINKLSE